MKIVGLTGGIGSGKTTVATLFQKELGIPIYIADTEAKKIMATDPRVITMIKSLVGEKAYYTANHTLNRKYIADRVFGNPDLLQALNAIIHPAVALHFNAWAKTQKSLYVIKEAAILFENGGYQQCNKVILVTAPQEVRIQRVLKRDQSTRAEILKRIQLQWPDERKKKLADYCINNIKLEKTKAEVQKIHNNLVKSH